MQKPQQGTYHPIIAGLLLVCLLDVISEKLTDRVLCWMGNLASGVSIPEKKRETKESRMKRLMLLVILAIFAMAIAAMLGIIVSTLNTGHLPW